MNRTIKDPMPIEVMLKLTQREFYALRTLIKVESLREDSKDRADLISGLLIKLDAAAETIAD